VARATSQRVRSPFCPAGTERSAAERSGGGRDPGFKSRRVHSFSARLRTPRICPTGNEQSPRTPERGQKGDLYQYSFDGSNITGRMAPVWGKNRNSRGSPAIDWGGGDRLGGWVGGSGTPSRPDILSASAPGTPRYETDRYMPIDVLRGRTVGKWVPSHYFQTVKTRIHNPGRLVRGAPVRKRNARITLSLPASTLDSS